MESFNDIEIARGNFEAINQTNNTFLIVGWMLLPYRECSSFRLYVNGQLAGSSDVMVREDVRHFHPWIPHASQSGFYFCLEGSITGQRTGYIDVIGFDQKDRPVARMNTLYRADFEAIVKTPPAGLMERVSNTKDARLFKIGGLKLYGEFVGALNRYCDISSVQRMLDWGCGCGRITAHFLLNSNIREIFGCDIDPEAINWCNTYLQPGKFLNIQLYPPTPYEDSTFNIVIASSVLTHLDRKIQDIWLAEMNRIIIPGGLFLASTHGEFAALFAFQEFYKETESLHKKVGKHRNIMTRSQKHNDTFRSGIIDDITQQGFQDIAPEDYYRCVYQTREYTVREWSQYFEVLEYIERGLGNFQDLVVMRRPV